MSVPRQRTVSASLTLSSHRSSGNCIAASTVGLCQALEWEPLLVCRLGAMLRSVKRFGLVSPQVKPKTGQLRWRPSLGGHHGRPRLHRKLSFGGRRGRCGGGGFTFNRAVSLSLLSWYADGRSDAFLGFVPRISEYRAPLSSARSDASMVGFFAGNVVAFVLVKFHSMRCVLSYSLLLGSVNSSWVG